MNLFETLTGKSRDEVVEERMREKEEEEERKKKEIAEEISYLEEKILQAHEDGKRNVIQLPSKHKHVVAKHFEDQGFKITTVKKLGCERLCDVCRTCEKGWVAQFVNKISW